jgi:hypothetical protein
MFPHSSDCIEEYTTSVTGFIKKCIAVVVPTVTVRTYPNQKSWIIRNPTMPSRRTVKQAKGKYMTKIESYYTGSDARRMWQGLQSVTDYKGKPSHELSSDTSLPDELNNFYAHFEASNTEACMRAPAVPDDCVIILTVAGMLALYAEFLCSLSVLLPILIFSFY